MPRAAKRVRFPPLTEEQRQLFDRNTSLAYWAARRLERRYVDVRRLGRDDADQAALLGLLLAVRRFDPSRGVRFSTYAIHGCRQCVLRAAVHAWPVTLPGAYLSRGHQYHEWIAAVRRRSSIAATDDSLGHSQHTADSRSRFQSGDVIDPASLAPDGSLPADLLRHLPTRYRRLVELRFGEGLTLGEVGRRMGGICKERVRQVERRALALLRDVLDREAEG